MNNKWIKFEKELATGDPKVLRIASRLRNAGVTPESLYTLVALGALTRLWSFADTHISDDNTLSCSLAEINEVIGIANFCDLLPAEWLQVLDGNRVHLPDFLQHNGIKARTRAQGAERQKRYRAKHNGSVTPSSRKSNAQSNGEVTNSALPKTIDLRPILKKEKTEKKENARASRLPADWVMTDPLADYARSMGLDAARIAEDFRDYWHALPGARGVKLDWVATWRKWCRSQLDRPPAPTRPNGHANGAGTARDVAAWAEANAAAKAIGFRAPWPQESVGAYLTDIKLQRDRPPAFSLSQLAQRAQQR